MLALHRIDERDQQNERSGKHYEQKANTSLNDAQSCLLAAMPNVLRDIRNHCTKREASVAQIVRMLMKRR